MPTKRRAMEFRGETGFHSSLTHENVLYKFKIPFPSRKSVALNGLDLEVKGTEYRFTIQR